MPVRNILKFSLCSSLTPPCSREILPPKQTFHQRIPKIRNNTKATATAPTAMNIFFFPSEDGSKSTQRRTKNIKEHVRLHSAYDEL